MARLLTLLIFLGVTPVLALDSCDLCGTWKSHEQRTLEEVARSKLVTPKQGKLFESDFFGRLIIEMRPGQGRSYFEDEDPASVAWENNAISVLAPGVYLITSKTGGEVKTRAVRIRGDCFVVELTEFDFGEWFCLISE